MLKAQIIDRLVERLATWCQNLRRVCLEELQESRRLEEEEAGVPIEPAAVEISLRCLTRWLLDQPPNWKDRVRSVCAAVGFDIAVARMRTIWLDTKNDQLSSSRRIHAGTDGLGK